MKPRLNAAKVRAEGAEDTQGFLFLKDSKLNGPYKIEKENHKVETQDTVLTSEKCK